MFAGAGIGDASIDHQRPHVAADFQMPPADLHRSRAEAIGGEHAGDPGTRVEGEQRQVVPVELADRRRGNAKANAGDRQQFFGSRGTIIHGHGNLASGERATSQEQGRGRGRAKAYDIVINGYEAGGGSIRIHDQELQRKMFNTIGFTDEQAKERFGFLLEAFRYGTPPHGGLAFGLDRLTMLLAKTDNIRDVIAFPKVQNASDLMTNAPDVVDDKQLEELKIKTVGKSE